MSFDAIAVPAPAAPPQVTLRFHLPAGSAIAEDPLLDAAAAPLRGRNITEIWFDTPGLSLLRNGFALSILRARRGHTQTLRQAGSVVSAPIEEAMPDPAAFGPGWREALAALLQDEPLATAFTTQIKRLTRRAGAVAVEFETGSIQTATEKLAVRELALRGPPAELYQLALALAEKICADLAARLTGAARHLGDRRGAARGGEGRAWPGGGNLPR
jgi:inorganic triphosphatase YgiF